MPSPSQDTRTPRSARATDTAQDSDSRRTTDLFAQMFPNGIRLTADNLDEVHRWVELTDRLGHLPVR